MAKVWTLEMVNALEATAAATKPGSVEIRSLEQEVIVKDLSQETDEQIMDRMRTRFSILEDMTRAVKAGHVRAMIVSGPPGVGKSFGVEAVLGRHDVFANVADDSKLKKYEVVRVQCQQLDSTRSCTSSRIVNAF